MERRTFLGVSSAAWLLSLPGCLLQRPSDYGLGRGVDIGVYNRTGDEQTVTVSVTEDESDIIHDEQYVLSLDGTGGNVHWESDVGRANRTYRVEVTAGDRRAERELEPSQPGVITIAVLERTIDIHFEPAEG